MQQKDKKESANNNENNYDIDQILQMGKQYQNLLPELLT